jgi:aarF domain-containing kinase
MATVATTQPCSSSWTRGSIPISTTTITRRRFRGKTNLKRLKILAAVVEETTPSSNIVPLVRNGTNRVLTLPFNRADDIQAEARAMTRAINATLYSPELLASKYGSQRIKVFTLTITFFAL